MQPANINITECLGPAGAFFLSLPEQVTRRNGTRVPVAPRISDIAELKALWKVAQRREFLLTFPFFCYVTWSLPYLSAYLTPYFSVRSRALASLVSAIAQVVATLLFGAFLDWQRVDLNRRAKYGYLGMMAFIGGCWVWGTIVQRDYQLAKPALDWDDAGFGRGWALYIFWQVNFSLTYNYGFWLIGWLGREPKDTVRLMSVARGVEAAGQAVSSGISSTTTPVSFSICSLLLMVLCELSKRLTDHDRSCSPR